MGNDKGGDTGCRCRMNPVMRITVLQNANHYLDQLGNDPQLHFSVIANSHTPVGFFLSGWSAKLRLYALILTTVLLRSKAFAAYYFVENRF
jgi:hypothetical protein